MRGKKAFFALLVEEREGERDLNLRVMRSEFISVTSLSCQTGDNVQKYSSGSETGADVKWVCRHSEIYWRTEFRKRLASNGASTLGKAFAVRCDCVFKNHRHYRGQPNRHKALFTKLLRPC